MTPLFSEESHIDSETVFDILVNVIPMVILLVFIFSVLTVRPWEGDSGAIFLSEFLMLFPLTILAVLTYLSARVIARDQDKMESSEE